MKNSINQKNISNHKSNRKNTIKYIPLALAISLGISSCDKDDEFAPLIETKQSSLNIETGEAISPDDYFMVTDDEDPNPTIIVDINDVAIDYNKPHTFEESGNFNMNCEARDVSGNMSSAKIKINVGSGLPNINGLENIQSNINPEIDIPMNLLSGISATDNKDGDISDNIKVFIKNIAQQREEIEDPTNYILNYPTTLEIKYQIQDSDGNNIEEIKTLDIQPKNRETIAIPQMNIRPTDPGFTADNIEYTKASRFDYLDTLKVLEANSMGKVMIRNGLENMSAEKYLEELNNRQIIGHGYGPQQNKEEIEGMYTLETESGSNTGLLRHDYKVMEILCGKKDNGIGATGVIGNIIQQPGINKIQRIVDTGRAQLEEKLDNTKKNIIFVVGAADQTNLYHTNNEEEILGIRNLVNASNCIIFASGTNTIDYGDTRTNKLRKEGYEDNDPRGIYSIPASITGVQCIGGCRTNFQANMRDEYRLNSTQSRFIVGDSKDIRYTPANHAYENDGKIYSDESGASSYATPSFTGLAYLVMMTNPSITNHELLAKMNECKKEVPANYYIDPSQSYMSKTVDPSIAFAEIIATVPTEISLSSNDLISIPRNGYKFSIPHGDAIVKADGTPLTQEEIDNISTRGALTQEEFFINPDELKKLGYKEGDTLKIYISACSDGKNNFEQIRNKSYDIKLLP